MGSMPAQSYVRDRWWRGAGAAVMLLVLCLATSPPVSGQVPAPPPPASTTEPTPSQVRQLLGLLADPAVRTWIEQTAAGQPVTAAPPTAAGAEGLQPLVSRRLADLRANVRSLVAA